jgi:hypothetical protein
VTLEQLKDLLSTYGVNDEERGAPILVNINGVETPITAGEIDYTYDAAHTPFVLLQTGEQYG